MGELKLEHLLIDQNSVPVPEKADEKNGGYTRESFDLEAALCGRLESGYERLPGGANCILIPGESAPVLAVTWAYGESSQATFDDGALLNAKLSDEIEQIAFAIQNKGGRGTYDVWCETGTAAALKEKYRDKVINEIARQEALIQGDYDTISDAIAERVGQAVNRTRANGGGT